MKIVKTDLFEYIKNRKNFCIAHVVNNQRKMGSGFVIPLIKHYPFAKTMYMNNTPELGECQLLYDSGAYIGNLCAQTLGGKRPLLYNKLVKAMDDLRWKIGNLWDKVGVNIDEIISPKFGAGLAGGDWNIISELIVDCWEKEGIPVTICLKD